MCDYCCAIRENSQKHRTMSKCLEKCQANMKRVATSAVTVILIINISIAVFVMHCMITRSPNQSSNSGNRDQMKINLEKAYMQYSEKKPDDIRLRKHEGSSNNAITPSLEFLSLLKPVAHFSGLDFGMELKDGRNYTEPIRNWANSEGSERTLLYNDMTYQNGSITVPVAGVYHITSHVKFYVEDNKKDHNSSQTFHHQIVRYSASSQKQVVLFENVVTECREGINDGAHLEYPSLTGGLAQIDAGDQVIVRVSHFDLLKHDRDWHYFDIYLV